MGLCLENVFSLRKTAIALLLALTLFGTAQAEKIEIYDNFESYQVSTYPSPTWKNLFSGKTAYVSDYWSWNSQKESKSFRLEGYPSWARIDYIPIPQMPDKISYEAVVHPTSSDGVRRADVGFTEGFWNYGPMFNYISFAGNGDIKWVVDWSGGYSVKIGTWEPGESYRVRAEIDFVSQTADVYLWNGVFKLVAKDLPALPKEFDHQEWGHVKLSKFGLSTGNFRDSGTNVVYFDDIKLETFQRIWPVGAPTTTCYTSGGKALPSTGENSADWFNYGYCGNWKVFDVTPGKELKFALRGDECPSCPGCVLGDIDFDIYEYVNGQWVLKKSVDGPNNYCGYYDYFYYYTPQSDKIKVVAKGGFYLELYQEFSSEPQGMYKFVYPLIYLSPLWNYNGYNSIAGVTTISNDTNVYVDADFDGVDDDDIKFTIPKMETINIGKTSTGAEDVTWQSNPAVIYTDKPVYAGWYYHCENYGMYDTGDMYYNPPVPGTTLVGSNVRWLFVTPYESPADVYVNGEYYGHINYGEVLRIDYTIPTDVVVDANSPVVAVAAYVDVSTYSGAYAYALMPPMSGDYIIPPSVANYATSYGADSVEEYYVVMDSQGNIVDQSNLPSKPKTLSYNFPVSVYIFRTFKHGDPWWGNTPRYVKTATEIRPTNLESVLIADVDVTGTHTRVISSITANGSGTVETDDSTFTFSGEYYVDSNDISSRTRYTTTGQFSGSSLWLQAWNYEIGGGLEKTTTTLGYNSSKTPPNANAGGPYTANESEEITFNASLSYDPDGDSLQYRWDFDNDGVWDTDWLNEPIISHTYVDDYQGTVVLEVTDGELTTKATADVTVLNVPPSVNITADDEVYAGAGLIINAAFTDPGDDTHTATIDWGDGVVDSITNAVSPIVANHTYNTKGVYAINVTVMDDDGGVGYNSVNVKVKVINATVEFGMDTLNLKSKVKWILCYIELEEGNVTQINGSTVYLEYNNTTIPAYIGEQGWAKSEATDGNIVDSDGDGLLERMVGFNKSSIVVDEGEHVFYVKGQVAYNGYMVWFEGSDVLKVINKERGGKNKK